MVVSMNVVHKKLSKARKLSKEVEVEVLSQGIISMPLLNVFRYPSNRSIAALYNKIFNGWYAQHE